MNLSSSFLFFLGFLLCFQYSSSKIQSDKNVRNATQEYATVYYQNGSYIVSLGVYDPHNGVSFGYFINEMYQTGWNRLKVITSPDFEDEVQAYAAGYLEGYVTQSLCWDLIYTAIKTVIESFFEVNLSNVKNLHELRENVNYFKAIEYLMNFYPAYQQWIQNQVKENQNDTYWKYIRLHQQQTKGLMDGYNAAASTLERLLAIEFFILQNNVDMLDLLPASQLKRNPKMSLENPYLQMEPREAFRKSHMKHLRCSSLVKVTKDDLLSSHDTWSYYFSMIRVFKQYTFFFKQTNGYNVLFSSYPGLTISSDDFYVLGSGLVVMETTNNIFNLSLYNLVTPNSVLYGPRTWVANLMAQSGNEWVDVFSKYNSGTYNNQWMVVDYNKFKPGASIENGTLWIAEQIPGKIESRDVSNVLREKGYWASYNIPYFVDIYNASGYTEMEKQQGDMWSYGHCPRANIFRRDQGKVNDLWEMMHIMRENNYKNDPLSKGDPSFAISSRFDLESGSTRQAFGGIDSKITNSKLYKQMACWAVSGPTHQNLPPFVWSKGFPNAAHSGPDTWDFDWEKIVLPTPGQTIQQWITSF